jgi:hypothetical protein
MNGVVAARMKASNPEVPIALLSSDERLAPGDLEAVDSFLSRSEPISSLLEKN